MSIPYFPGFDDNDTYHVDQSNELVDSDSNINQGTLLQEGAFHFSDVDQDIDSGDNGQSNGSWILDDGYGFGYGADDNDYFSVSQSNLMDDSDYNVNEGSLFQAGVYNVGHVDQDIDSGDNHQSNSSTIEDLGGYHSYGWGPGTDDNDSFHVDQSNFMIDNDVNVNVANLAQAGFANVADIDQEIDSGGNTQDNFSFIGDYNSPGYGYDDNDAFHVSQASLMADADENANLVDAGQHGALNGGWFDQDITSGGNSQENVSDILDLGA